MATPPYHAVVFGASGINGWALIKELLTGYPTPDTFSRVTAVLNRPLSLPDSQWPQDGRLQVATEVDLTADVKALQGTIKTKITGAESISHVYYAGMSGKFEKIYRKLADEVEAYKQSDDPQEECRANTEMLRGAINAIENLSKALTCVVLITGTKAYGLQMLDKFPYKDQVPLSESLPRIPPEYAKDVFYYHEVDALKDLSQGKSWTWCEVRPDVIVSAYRGPNPVGYADHRPGRSRSHWQCSLHGPDDGHLPQSVRLRRGSGC